MHGGASVTVEQPLLGVRPEEIASVTVGVAPPEDPDATTTVRLTVTPRNPEGAIARSAGEKLAAVGAALRSGETTFTNHHERPLSTECATVETRRQDDTTTLLAHLRVVEDPPETERTLHFENRGDAFVPAGAAGPPTPPADDGSASGLLGPVRERLFAARSAPGVTVTDEELRVETDWPDERTVRADLRVVGDAVLVYLFGETVAGDGERGRTEVARRIDPPFGLTAAGASARLTDGRLSVTVPRSDAPDREDGGIAVEAAE